MKYFSFSSHSSPSSWPPHQGKRLQNMSGRNLCFRTVERCKSCWFLYNQRFVNPGKVGLTMCVLFNAFSCTVNMPCQPSLHRWCTIFVRLCTAFFLAILWARRNIEPRGINILTEYVSWAEYYTLWIASLKNVFHVTTYVPSLYLPRPPP